MARSAFLVPLLAILPTLLGACRKETIDQPDAPGMNDVLDAFASPSGTLDASTVAALRSGIDGATSGLLGAGVPDRIVGAITEAVSEAQKKNGAKTSSLRPLDFVGEGFGRVTRICDGWGAVPVPDDAANGHLALTFTFDETLLDPVIWGDIERCHYLVGGKRLALEQGGATSALRLYIGDDKKLAELTTSPLVLALDAKATLDDLPIAAKLAVRFVYKSADVELLVPIPNGEVVVTTSGGQVLRVRAKNGTFQCNAATKVCKGDAGGEVTL